MIDERLPSLKNIPSSLYKARLADESGLIAPTPGRFRVDAKLVAGFTERFLLSSYDNPQPIAHHHRLLWEVCCGPWRNVAVAAPRRHAKSTSLSLAYLLSAVLFGERDYVLLVSDAPATAEGLLGDISATLQDNDLLTKVFEIKGFERLTQDDIEVVLGKDRRFRVQTRSTGQSPRGLKWRNRRPNLILMDDGENDEQVMNADRRKKLLQWFLNALYPAGSSDCIYRVAGSILHEDSLLSRLLDAESWTSVRLDSHNDAMTDILWPEAFPADRLRGIKAMFTEQGNADGYAREMRSKPVTAGDGFFKTEEFGTIDEKYTSETRMTYVIGVDLAVSTNKSADYSAFVVLGLDRDDYANVVHVIRGRYESPESIEIIFELNEVFKPAMIVMEGGPIEKALRPVWEAEMARRNVDLPIISEPPGLRDKALRARPLQQLMRQKRVRFMKDADWYQTLEDEMMVFPRSKNDDQVDALAWAARMLNEVSPPAPEDDLYWSAVQQARDATARASGAGGKNNVTGY